MSTDNTAPETVTIKAVSNTLVANLKKAKPYLIGAVSALALEKLIVVGKAALKAAKEIPLETVVDAAVDAATKKS